MPRASRFLCALWLTAVLAACSGDGQIPEEQIRQFIDAGVDAAENRSVDRVGEQLHSNYLDQKGHNKKQLLTLLRGLFFRHRDIYLFTRIGDIELLSDSEAIVKLHVAMAGSAISDIDALARLRADLYEFELHLIKGDEWQAQHAKWRRASLADFE